MVPSDTFTPLREQLNYYRARAGEYDQWWLRQGRYDHGEALSALWFAEAAEVSSALSAFQACGARARACLWHRYLERAVAPLRLASDGARWSA